MNPIKAAFAATLAALATGCASAPATEMTAAGTSIARAVADDATQPELTRAADKLALSQRLSTGRQFDPARWLAEQAEIDAELAAARAANRRFLTKTSY